MVSISSARLEVFERRGMLLVKAKYSFVTIVEGVVDEKVVYDLSYI